MIRFYNISYRQPVILNVAKLLEVYVYGEGQTNDKEKNLRGQLYQHYDGSGMQQVNEYDFKGNPLETEQQLLDDPELTDADWDDDPDLSTEIFTSSITYDALNRPVTTTDPGSNLHEFTYDKGGALKTVELNTDDYVNDIHYNSKGQRSAIWYGNGTKTSYTYDTDTFRLRRLLTVNVDTLSAHYNEILQDLHYWYDPVGNITEIQDDAQQTLFYNNSVVAPSQKFTYDALYRLIEAKGRELIGTANFGAEDNWNDAAWQTTHKGDGNAVQNYTQHYTYDEVGNILELQHVASTGSYTRTYDIDTVTNKLMSTEVGMNTYEYDYDTRGNMMKMPHLSSMVWNMDNELSIIVKGSEPTYYQYSGGQRIRKYTDKGTIKEERIYLGGYEIYRKFDNTSSLILERTTVHISDDTARIAMQETRTSGTDPSPAELTRYIYSNHLQSASLELNEDAAIISYEEYHPYGTTAYQAMNTSIAAVAKRYRYTGKERDEESGLYYHGARYYIPWLARWSAVDALQDEMPTWSPYNYGFCNPVKWTDTTGMQPDGEDRDAKGIWYATGTVTQDGPDAGTIKWDPNLSLNEFAEKYKDKPRAMAFRSDIGDFGKGTSYHTRTEYTDDGKIIITIMDDTDGGRIKSKKTEDFNPVKKAIEKKIEPKAVAEKEAVTKEKDNNSLPVPVDIDTRKTPTGILNTVTEPQNAPTQLERIEPTKLQKIESNNSDFGLSVGGLVLSYIETGMTYHHEHSPIDKNKKIETWGRNVGKKILNTVKWAGRITGAISVGKSIVKFINEPSFENFGKAGLNALVTFGTRANVIGLGINILYTIADESGLIDQLFNKQKR